MTAVASFDVETRCWAETLWVIGFDEVGRGPVAGPVTVAAVAATIPFGFEVRDSKLWSPRHRETAAAATWNLANTKGFSVAVMSTPADVVDNIGISQAISKAATTALDALRIFGVDTDDATLIFDGLHPFITPENAGDRVIAKAKLDQSSAVVAAASNVAKVDRDAHMMSQDEPWPGYGFSSHKGYGTKAHLEAIARLGLTPLHRRTFLTNHQPPDGWKNASPSKPDDSETGSAPKQTTN